MYIWMFCACIKSTGSCLDVAWALLNERFVSKSTPYMLFLQNAFSLSQLTRRCQLYQAIISTRIFASANITHLPTTSNVLKASKLND